MEKNNKKTTSNNPKKEVCKDAIIIATQIITKHVNAFKELAK